MSEDKMVAQHRSADFSDSASPATRRRLYKFKPFGPFELPLEESAVIARHQLSEFWNEAERQNKNVTQALGCYIYAIQTADIILPWYVGKTEKKSFRFEVVQASKILHYERALRLQPGGKPLLYLLPRMTDQGGFRRIWKGGSSSVARLERMLIETALARNPQLMNRNMVRHLTQTELPGYRNEPTGPRSPQAEALARLLGTGHEARLPLNSQESQMTYAVQASNTLASAVRSLQTELGEEIVRKIEVRALFRWNGEDYETSLRRAEGTPTPASKKVHLKRKRTS